MSESPQEPAIRVQLSENRWLPVRDFKKMKLIDIREFYTKDGEQLPSKKGISLTADQFTKLISRLPDIKAAAGIADADSTSLSEEEPESARKRNLTEFSAEDVGGKGSEETKKVRNSNVVKESKAVKEPKAAKESKAANATQSPKELNNVKEEAAVDPQIKEEVS